MQRGRLIRRDAFNGPMTDAWLGVCACLFLATLGVVSAAYAMQASSAWRRSRVVVIGSLLIVSALMLAECTADTGVSVR